MGDEREPEQLRWLQRRTAGRAEELPGAELSHPFGDEYDVWRVRGKVFMIHTAVTGEPIVILKAAPEAARFLREAHAHITPGYHMNKRHWITVHPGGDFDDELLDDLVTESYLLVIEKNVPRRERPVDPETFGR
ncbi:MmcQ/YjbR family DNA-binding protein [Sediminivirga luteola]|uniref:MmcQ/YjbR family DNA-binding protein n=1 Tax=Sediminivirga luteola TaxID=1774748 RepID=UPI001F5A8DC6|nr:MmcQ/YjbR family DNA-binding protein [Sediminivirga luteola]MCI2266018.1 MmcQ/YjbR family DNA-binding protein [Sediminivirga luteola]